MGSDTHNIFTHTVGRVLLVAGALALVIACGCSDDNSCINGVDTTVVNLTKDCVDCHVSVAALEGMSRHMTTLEDVAGELAAERVGETPDEVLNGADAENCIACHGPTAVLANGGMTEVEAMRYFFSTVDDKFTDQTEATHSGDWSHVTCEACHNASAGHPASTPQLALFDSRTATYTPMNNSSALCGQCHGSLRFADTDHLTQDAWALSRHGDDQQDVADELAAERAGESPREVVTGDDPENCIACHAPTAVMANGGMDETAALAYFFTTSGGAFTGGTAIQHESEWPDVACLACHDQHAPDVPAYFNSSTRQYEQMADTAKLCGRCHGSLRFANTDHRTYDLREGTGGIGVSDGRLMPSVTCVDCHMYASDVDGSNSSMYHGHRFAIDVTEDAGSTVSCIHCHPSMDATAQINSFKTAYANLDATASANVELATTAMDGVTDPVLLDKLAEAEHNLEYAESDESGGFHNNSYLMALLNDANDRALEILAATP